MGRYVARHLISGLLVLIAITYLSFLAQDYAARSSSGQAAPPAQVAADAWQDSLRLWRALPGGQLGEYSSPTGPYGTRRQVPLKLLLGKILSHSLGLLALAVLLGGWIGSLLGTLAAALKRRDLATGLILLSILGISTPSFTLGMLLQFLEITLYRRTGLRLLPVGGFGWDSHLVMPVLVLAARPIAQVTRLTYGRVGEILAEDYVRTAHAKGLFRGRIWRVHILPNAAITVLTAMGTSLRLALSSLPVVEFLFGWPGIGRVMLDMLQTGQRHVATVLVLAMGATLIGVNLLLDLLYRLIDPRLRQTQAQVREEMGFGMWLLSLLEGLWGALTLRHWRERRRRQVAIPLQRTPPAIADAEGPLARLGRSLRRLDAAAIAVIILGGLLGALLLMLLLLGPSLADPASYSPTLTVLVGGRAVDPPVPPSRAFPLGTDRQGRDILSLLLVGARRTLSMAAFAMLVRLAIGTLLGLVAGWFAGSRVDRAIMGLAEAVAAFPALVLAMLVVFAVGIKQGLTAFVAALAVIGWGEVMQTVRSRVMRIKPMEYIESALATGLTQGQIMGAHVLPNLWPTLLSLAFLEMGGVLMLLGELGFLGVFIGGGLAAEGDWAPAVIYYDIPEWSVMLAHAWKSFRSYPWTTLYPGLAFFLAIASFTLLGEGLRWLTERLTFSLHSVLNRYTVVALAVVVLGARWMFESTGLYSSQRPLAMRFDAARALEDIRPLASPRYHGRLSGTPQADQVAAWIAAEFERLGLQPAGETAESYEDTWDAYHYRDLYGVPRLVLHGPHGETLRAEYGRDFVRRPGRQDIGGSGMGELVLVASSPDYIQTESQGAGEYGLTAEAFRRRDRILLHLQEEWKLGTRSLGRSGVLTMHVGPFDGRRYELLYQSEKEAVEAVPGVYVSRELVKRLLRASGQSLDALLSQVPRERGERALYLPLGWTAELDLPVVYHERQTVRNIMGRWPGSDVVLNKQVVLVTAYYDGLGRSPDGALYPGANDNASGVATLLEMVRCLKEGSYQPKRTLMFVAWSGGERHTPVDYERFMRAHPAYTLLDVVAALEIEGVGAGSGSAATLSHANRQKLTAVLRKAARRVGTPLTTRATGLHADPERWPAPKSEIPSATLSWAGADAVAHLPEDTPEAIDPAKLAGAGRLATLAVAVLGRDTAY